MFSIELLDAQTGDRKTNAEVCFTESNGFQKYMPRDQGYDGTFAQLRKVLEDERFQCYAQLSSEEKITFEAKRIYGAPHVESLRSDCLFLAAKIIMLYKQSDINMENLVKLAVTIGTSNLENASDGVIWHEYQKIKTQTSSATSGSGSATSMRERLLAKPDDANSCCAIM